MQMDEAVRCATFVVDCECESRNIQVHLFARSKERNQYAGRSGFFSARGSSSDNVQLCLDGKKSAGSRRSAKEAPCSCRCLLFTLATAVTR
jgi:hypothetical protein